MKWLTWRQNRVQIVGLVAFAIVLTLGIWLIADYSVRLRAEFGIDTCVPETRTIQTPNGPQTFIVSQNCADLTSAWQQRIGLLRYAFFTVYLVPALVASYVGGPLFAIEFERATHRLAWTQSISRVRWAAVKLGIILAVALIAALILAPSTGPSRVLMGIGRSGSDVRPFEAFDLEGPAVASYMLFGIAVAAFVGAWSRRILVAMFVPLLVFGLARVAVHNVRPWYQPPITVPYEVTSQVARDAWFIDVPAVDVEGRPVSREQVNALLGEYFRNISRLGPPSATNSDSTYLAEHGVFRRAGYQPADRYWTFQAIEAAIFTGLAALFALLTLWRVRTHDA
jgi:ABC-type transport system involved in multi-copper enzyme maturation permease subunit